MRWLSLCGKLDGLDQQLDLQRFVFQKGLRCGWWTTLVAMRWLSAGTLMAVRPGPVTQTSSSPSSASRSTSPTSGASPTCAIVTAEVCIKQIPQLHCICVPFCSFLFIIYQLSLYCFSKPSPIIVISSSTNTFFISLYHFFFSFITYIYKHNIFLWVIGNQNKVM